MKLKPPSVGQILRHRWNALIMLQLNSTFNSRLSLVSLLENLASSIQSI